MDLIDRLNKGSDLVKRDAEKLLSEQGLPEEYLTAAAQKAVKNVLDQNRERPFCVIPGASIKDHLETVSPANA